MEGCLECVLGEVGMRRRWVGLGRVVEGCGVWGVPWGGGVGM